MPDPAELFLSLLFGLIGTSVYIYGKRCTNIRHILLGIALIGFPWFISGLWPTLLVGVGLCVGVYVLRD